MQENFTQQDVAEVEYTRTTADIDAGLTAEGETRPKSAGNADETLTEEGTENVDTAAEEPRPQTGEEPAADNPQEAASPFDDYLRALSTLYNRGVGLFPGRGAQPAAGVPGFMGNQRPVGFDPAGQEMIAQANLDRAAMQAFGTQMSADLGGGDLDWARQRTIKNAMDRDLQQVRAVNPEIQSLEELPPIYRALRFNDYAPMDAAAAYSRAMAVAGAKPASTGSMAARETPAREYFTGDELDRLGPDDLKDPAVYKKAMKSLLRL